MKKFISLILCAVTFAVSAFCQASYTEKSYSGKVVILREDCVLWNKDAESGKIKWISGESKNVKVYIFNFIFSDIFCICILSCFIYWKII